MQLDAGTWAACTSPKTLTGLIDGSHTFSVRATDAATNTDATPATRTSTIDTTPPQTSPTPGPASAAQMNTSAPSPAPSPAAWQAFLTLPGFTIAQATDRPRAALSLAKPSLALGRMTARATIRVRATLVARLPAAAPHSSVHAARNRAQVLGRFTTTMKRGESRTLKLRLPAKIRKRLRGLTHLRVTLKIQTTLSSSRESHRKRKTFTLKVRR